MNRCCEWAAFHYKKCMADGKENYKFELGVKGLKHPYSPYTSRSFSLGSTDKDNLFNYQSV